jgi:hypothetical protein
LGHAGLGLNDELFAAVSGEIADFQRDRLEGRFLFGEAADQFLHFDAQLLLPGFGGALIGRFIGQRQGGVGMALGGPEDGVEGRHRHFAFEAIKGSGVDGFGSGCGGGRGEGSRGEAELATIKFGWHQSFFVVLSCSLLTSAVGGLTSSAMTITRNTATVMPPTISQSNAGRNITLPVYILVPGRVVARRSGVGWTMAGAEWAKRGRARMEGLWRCGLDECRVGRDAAQMAGLVGRG